MPLLKPGDLSGGTVLSTDYYAGRALFGYIDGGAELYLEYKFKKLGRQEVQYSGERIVVEMYQMEGINEAYGVFSVQRFKCVPVDSLSLNTCLSKFQLQAVVGNCYLSIVNETGSSAARKGSVEIFRAIQSKVKPVSMKLPLVFQSAELAPHLQKLIIAYGQFGVQNGFSDWDSLFQTIPRFSLTLLPLEIGSEHLAIAHIRFVSDSESREFCRLAGFTDVAVGSMRTYQSGGLARLVRRLNNEELYFGEATVAFPGRESLFKLLSK
jgi:hypothetical protein